MVERFHRTLKATLSAQLADVHWMDELPIILLAPRAKPKEDLGTSPAELVHGSTLTLPGEIVDANIHTPVGRHELLPCLRAAMQSLRILPPL